MNPFILQFEKLKSADTPREFHAAADLGTDEELLVERGRFRVDTSKAIEKLAQFQTANPQDFLSHCVRAAVAAGATKLEIDENLGRLSLAFNGRGLSRDFFSDPYIGLFSNRASEAGKAMALGLLALGRLNPRTVRLSQRTASGHLSIVAGEQSFWDPQVGLPLRGSLLEIAWNQMFSPLRSRLCSRLSPRFGMSEVELWVNGTQLPSWIGEKWQRGNLDGSIVASPKGSEIRLYKWGVLLETIPYPIASANIAILVRADRIKTNLSTSAAVRDADFDELIKTVKAASRPWRQSGRKAILVEGSPKKNWVKSSLLSLAPWFIFWLIIRGMVAIGKALMAN